MATQPARNIPGGLFLWGEGMMKHLLPLLPCLGIIFSCASVPATVVLAGPDTAALNRVQANRLAVVQVLVVRNGALVTGGSGCLVTEDGYVLTARHVVAAVLEDPAAGVLVNFCEQLYGAAVLGTDRVRDLAIVRVKTRTRLPCVHLAEIPPDANSRVTFLAVPPEWGMYRRGRYVKAITRLELSRLRPVLVNAPEDLITNPDTAVFFTDAEARRIVENPKDLHSYLEETFAFESPVKAEYRAVLDFFLLQFHSRLFFIDPDHAMLSGYSGGVWFDESGACLGLFQEILVSFKPNPASRYLDPRYPPEDSMRLALVDRMLCAGQSAEGIREFLKEQGIEIDKYRNLRAGFDD